MTRAIRADVGAGGGDRTPNRITKANRADAEIAVIEAVALAGVPVARAAIAAALCGG
jgi:hypothetical protein